MRHDDLDADTSKKGRDYDRHWQSAEPAPKQRGWALPQHVKIAVIIIAGMTCWVGVYLLYMLFLLFAA